MPQGVELATAYVSLAISAEGITDDIGRELGEPVEREARESGEKAGKGFSSSLGDAATAGLAVAAGLIGFDILLDAFTQELDKAALPAQLGAQFGLAGPEAEEAAKIAGELYSKGWGESIGEVGTTVVGLKKILKDIGSTEDVSKLTTQAQALGQTFNTDVNEVIKAASQLVKTKMAPDFETALNSITGGLQGGANAGGDFLDTLGGSALNLKQFGFDAGSAIAFLNQGIAAGAPSADSLTGALEELIGNASDGIETFDTLGLGGAEFASKLAGGGAEANVALGQLLDAMRAVEDPAERSRIMVELFGEEATAMSDAILALDPAAADAAGSMENMDGAAQNVADTIGSTTQASVETLGRSFQESLGGALSTVVPLLDGILKVLTPLAPILGPLALAIGVLALAQWAWNAALAVSPITWIILGVVALVAAIIWLWNNVDGFKQFWVDAWNWILDGIQFLWNWVKDNWPYLLIFLTGPFALIIAAVVIFWDEIVAFFKAGWEWIKGIFEWGVNAALAYFNFLAELPKKIAGWLMDAVKRGKEILSGFVEWVAGVPEDIIDGLSGLADAIYQIFRKAFNAVAGLWNDTIGSWSLDIPSWVPFIGGSSWSVPDIPMLATGGLIKRRPGGVLANIAEGREDEAVTPMSELRAMMQDAYDTGASEGTGRGGDNYWTINGYDKSPKVLAAEISWTAKARP